MSEHLLFLNIINVEKRCPEILRNNQLPFCASFIAAYCFFRVGISFRIQILSTYIKGTAIFLQRISKLELISRLTIDFKFQSKIVRNWSLPVARNRYPLPGYRNGVPCFHWDIRFLENLSVRLDSSTKKTFFLFPAISRLKSF